MPAEPNQKISKVWKEETGNVFIAILTSINRDMYTSSKDVLRPNSLLVFLLVIIFYHIPHSPTPCGALRTPTTSNRTLTPSAMMRKPRSRVYIGVLLPVDDDRQFSIQKCLPAIHHAFLSDFVKAVLPGFEFLTVNANSKCNAIAAPIEAFNMMAIEKVQVFFGPVCDYSLAPVARYSPTWDIPVISPGGMAHDFGADKRAKNAEYPLLTRVGLTFDAVAEVIYNVVHSYNWTNIKVKRERQTDRHRQTDRQRLRQRETERQRDRDRRERDRER